MLPGLKLSLNGVQLRDYPLLRCAPPDYECAITDGVPTEVSKSRNVKVSDFPRRVVSGWER